MSKNNLARSSDSSLPDSSLQSPKKSGTKRTLVVAAAGVVLLGVGVAAWAFWPRSVPTPTTPTEVLRLAASDNWNRLSPAQLEKILTEADRLSWADRMRMLNEAKLTDEERRKVFENLGQASMLRQVRRYVAMTPAEQKKELDRQIDEQEAARRLMSFGGMMGRGTSRPTTGPSAGPSGGGGRGGWGSPERTKTRMENSPPADRAGMAKFMGDMATRRAERGLPSWGAPGGGGGQRPQGAAPAGR